jgi:RNA polymerase sigma factor (sigma-70 family)
MHRPAPESEQRIYEQALGRAMRHAARHVAWDEAFEIAHDVANEVLRRRAARPELAANTDLTEGFIHLAVTNRLRNLARSRRRRAAAEGAHHTQRLQLSSVWATPATDLEQQELQEVVDAAVAGMPDGMREVFLLVRRDELPYKEVARRLGVGVGTVHTQLSRANSLLRRAIERYRADATALDLPQRLLKSTVRRAP